VAEILIIAMTGLVPVGRCSSPEAHRDHRNVTTEFVSVERCSRVRAGKHRFPRASRVVAMGIRLHLSGFEHSSTATSIVVEAALSKRQSLVKSHQQNGE